MYTLDLGLICTISRVVPGYVGYLSYVGQVAYNWLLATIFIWLWVAIVGDCWPCSRPTHAGRPALLSVGMGIAC